MEYLPMYCSYLVKLHGLLPSHPSENGATKTHLKKWAVKICKIINNSTTRCSNLLIFGRLVHDGPRT